MLQMPYQRTVVGFTMVTHNIIRGMDSGYSIIAASMEAKSE
jgi:hypothetical protein